MTDTASPTRPRPPSRKRRRLRRILAVLTAACGFSAAGVVAGESSATSALMSNCTLDVHYDSANIIRVTGHCDTNTVPYGGMWVQIESCHDASHPTGHIVYGQIVYNARQIAVVYCYGWMSSGASWHTTGNGGSGH